MAAIQKISNIAELKTRVGTSGNSVEVLGYYSEGDYGGGNYYWDSSSTALDNGGSIIQVTGNTTGRWKLVDTTKIDVRQFGAKGDGTTDDSVPIKSALSLISTDECKYIYFSDGLYKISSPVQNTITGKDGFVILMDKNAKLINTDYTDFTNATATYSSPTATVVTASPHTFTTGTQVAMDFVDKGYNGAYLITVLDANTFTYTPSYTPSGATTGRVRRTDYLKYFISLSGCSNANISINFEGTQQNLEIQQRLGWIAIKLQDSCSYINLALKCSGLSYGVWSGDFEQNTGNLSDSNISVDAYSVGYPVALWKSGNRCNFKVKGEKVHRGSYVTGCKDSNFDILVKNFEVTGIVISMQAVSGVLYGCENLRVKIKDYGSDVVSPTPRSAQLVTIIDLNQAGASEIKNIELDIEVINAKLITPLLMRTSRPTHNISNINIKGFLDRRALTDAELGYDFLLGGEANAGVSGTYSGINFLSWRSYNPDINTKYAYIDIKDLADDVNFVDLYSNAVRYFNVPTGKRVNINQKAIAGTTALRPSLSIYEKGFEYFDTDLGRPMWWSGTQWVDSYTDVVALATSSASYTKDTTYIEANATSGNQIVTLPDATTCRGKRFVIMKTDVGTNTVTVTPSSGSQKIEFSDNVVLRSTFSRVQIYSNGSNWRLMMYYNYIITTNNTDVVTNSFLNTNYPIASYPIGTTVLYTVQGKRFERINTVQWISSILTLP